MTRRALGLVAAALLVQGGGARAQVSTALEVGSGLDRAAPERMEPGVRLAPRLAVSHGWLDASLAGSLTRFMRPPASTAHLQGEVALRSPAWRCLSLSSALGGAWSDYAEGPGARRLDASARVACDAGGGASWWVGGSAGQVTARATRTLAGLEVGTRLGSGTRSLELSLRSSALARIPGLFRDSISYAPNDTLGLSPVVHRVVERQAVPSEGFVELAARAGWARGRLGAELDLGTRLRGADSVAQRWALGTLSFRLTPVVSLVAGYGSIPSDPALGLPPARRAMLSLRVSSRARVTVPSARPYFRVATLRPGVHALSARVPGARTVEIAGDFSDWAPIPLRPVGDEWVAELALAPGSYRLNLRIDGERWMTPPGLPAEPDDFGGEVGILVIAGDGR